MTGSDVKPGEGSATSLSLLDRARANDPAAWDRLVRLYTPLVDLWTKRFDLQDADAADVRQEVFIAVNRKLGEFRRDRGGDTFRGWLRTITTNKVRDLWKKRRGDAQAEPLDMLDRPGTGEAAEPADEERQLLYRRALELMHQDFEASSWQAFWRVVVDGQKPRDVAGELNISVNAVYLAKARVLARLREEFADVIDR